MSHFTCLVVGDNPEEQIQPYHEFECTGINDEYVVDVDETKEAKEQYERDTVTKLVSPDGISYDTYDDIFYRDPTPEEEREIGTPCGSGFIGKSNISFNTKDWGDGKGRRVKVYHVPDEYTKKEVPQRDVQTFAEFVEDWYDRKPVLIGNKPNLEGEHKYGYYVVDVGGRVLKVVDRTNPNKKWDWWALGGRWSGFFTLKDGQKADQALKKDIDFFSKFDERKQQAHDEYTAFHSILNGRSLLSWEEVREKNKGDIDAARKEYHEQPGMIELKKDDRFSWDLDVEKYRKDRIEFCEFEASRGMCTFAVVKDGKWYERGSMGWWGCVSGEKPDEEWITEYRKMLDDVDDETLLSVFDCHI